MFKQISSSNFWMLNFFFFFLGMLKTFRFFFCLAVEKFMASTFCAKLKFFREIYRYRQTFQTKNDRFSFRWHFVFEESWIILKKTICIFGVWILSWNKISLFMLILIRWPSGRLFLLRFDKNSWISRDLRDN